MNKLPVLLILALFLLTLGFLFGVQYQKASTVAIAPTAIPEASLMPEVAEGCTITTTDSLRIQRVGSNLCSVRVVYEWEADQGYTVNIPNTWSYELGGAANTNIALYDDEKAVFIGVAHSNIRFNDYDKLTYSYEMSSPSPVIESTEKKVSEETVVVGENNFLKVVTDKSTYYFTDNKQVDDKAVYYLEIENDSAPSQDVLETILMSFKPEVKVAKE
jgi:hypothetical protein